VSENLPARVKFFRDSIQQIIDSRAEPSYDMLRSLLVEDERLAEWERRTGTAPQRPKADPKKDVCPNCGEVANGCNYCRKTPAPAPQTEGECPEPFCRNGIMGAGITRRSCPTCSGTGKEKA
jgi:hypothetical protein